MLNDSQHVAGVKRQHGPAWRKVPKIEGSRWGFIGLMAAIAVLLLVALIVCICCIRRRRANKRKRYAAAQGQDLGTIHPEPTYGRNNTTHKPTMRPVAGKANGGYGNSGEQDTFVAHNGAEDDDYEAQGAPFGHPGPYGRPPYAGYDYGNYGQSSGYGDSADPYGAADPSAYQGHGYGYPHSEMGDQSYGGAVSGYAPSGVGQAYSHDLASPYGGAGSGTIAGGGGYEPSMHGQSSSHHAAVASVPKPWDRQTPSRPGTVPPAGMGGESTAPPRSGSTGYGAMPMPPAPAAMHDPQTPGASYYAQPQQHHPQAPQVQPQQEYGSYASDAYEDATVPAEQPPAYIPYHHQDGSSASTRNAERSTHQRPLPEKPSRMPGGDI